MFIDRNPVFACEFHADNLVIVLHELSDTKSVSLFEKEKKHLLLWVVTPCSLVEAIQA